MRNEISTYGADRRPMTRAEREQARKDEYNKTRRTGQIKAEVQEAAFKVDGALALAAHIMEGFVALDEHRAQLARDDQLRNLALGEIELQALRQVKGIQRGLYSEWNVG